MSKISARVRRWKVETTLAKSCSTGFFFSCLMWIVPLPALDCYSAGTPAEFPGSSGHPLWISRDFAWSLRARWEVTSSSRAEEDERDQLNCSAWDHSGPHQLRRGARGTAERGSRMDEKSPFSWMEERLLDEVLTWPQLKLSDWGLERWLWIRACAISADDSSSLPSTRIGWHTTTCDSSFRSLTPSSGPLRHWTLV